MVKDLINECGIDLDYVYITDARKVYPPESIRYKVNEFDNSETKELKKKYRRKLLMNKKNDDVNKALLYEEIKFCVPDIIIVLGTSGLSLVDNTLKLTEILGGDSLVYKNDKKYFLCPFPSRASTIYEKYKVKCAKNVREEIDILKKSLIESSM